MTVEAWSLTPEYTIAGTGPYTITHPYATDAIRAQVMTDAGLVTLGGSEFSVSPTAADIEGDLTLSITAATAYAGLPLIIDRVTPDEQGWLAVQGDRESGMEAQLDRIVQAIQELRLGGNGAVRIRGVLDAFDWQDGTVPLLDGNRVISGPTAAEIAAAQAHAETASAGAEEAAASAAAALAKQNSMLLWRGTWAVSVAYTPSNIVFSSGSAYICVVAHTSGVFATDLGAGKWALFAQQGSAGAGTGNMLNSENLSGLTDKPLAWTTLGGGAIGKLASIAFSNLAAAAVRTGVETIAANKTADNELATVKAVADYADAAADAGAAWLEIGASPYTLTGASPFNITGIGSPRDLMIVGLQVAASASGNRQVRVGTSGGFLAGAIYERTQGSPTTAMQVSDTSGNIRGFALIIYNFGTDDPVKPVHVISGSGLSEWPFAIVTTSILDRIQLLNSVAATLSGTVRVFGRG